jgi:hypothetical protein
MLNVVRFIYVRAHDQQRMGCDGRDIAPVSDILGIISHALICIWKDCNIFVYFCTSSCQPPVSVQGDAGYFSISATKG